MRTRTAARRQLAPTVDLKNDMSRRNQLVYILAPCLVLAMFVNPGVKMHLACQVAACLACRLVHSLLRRR